MSHQQQAHLAEALEWVTSTGSQVSSYHLYEQLGAQDEAGGDATQTRIDVKGEPGYTISPP
jgi:hypothetical protein